MSGGLLGDVDETDQVGVSTYYLWSYKKNTHPNKITAHSHSLWVNYVVFAKKSRL